MNKGMIMLGLLLIVGLSFAISGWAGLLGHRYECNYYEMVYYQDYWANYYSMGTQTERDNLFYAMQDMYWDWLYMEEYVGYPATFRTYMGHYNSDGLTFNAIFNTVVRAYLYEASPQQKADLLAILEQLKSNYQSCVSPAP